MNRGTTVRTVAVTEDTPAPFFVGPLPAVPKKQIINEMGFNLLILDSRCLLFFPPSTDITKHLSVLGEKHISNQDCLAATILKKGAIF